MILIIKDENIKHAAMTGYPSKALETAVNELSRLPGVGKRTALRLALHLLKQDDEDAESLGNAVIKLKKDTRFCVSCFNISDEELCGICANTGRDSKTICIVEDIRDVMAIENTSQYKGIYHVLGGSISPMDGIGPDELTIEPLLNKIDQEGIAELIFALPATIEGDTTSFYIYRKISVKPLKVTAIARGISVGDELEYADLGYALLPEYWSQGFAREASLAILNDGHENHNLNVIAAITYPDNVSSNNLLKKLGFSLKGQITLYELDNNLYEFKFE